MHCKGWRKERRQAACVRMNARNFPFPFRHSRRVQDCEKFTCRATVKSPSVCRASYGERKEGRRTGRSVIHVNERQPPKCRKLAQSGFKTPSYSVFDIANVGVIKFNTLSSRSCVALRFVIEASSLPAEAKFVGPDS